MAHRLSYGLYYDFKIMEPNFLVYHDCNNTSCINPFHLYEGSNKKNILQAVNDKGINWNANPKVNLELLEKSKI